MNSKILESLRNLPASLKTKWSNAQVLASNSRFGQAVSSASGHASGFAAVLWRILTPVVMAPVKFFLVLLSGIRAKLAWFTAVLILVTVVVLSFVYLQQQQAILTESYEREAAISQRYISSLVLEIDNISQSLIRTEDFRNRVAEQREALKRFRTTRVVTQEKQVSLFGIRTNLFGALGTQRVRRSAETYYSAYLSDRDVDALEDNSREQLQGSGGAAVSDRDFVQLQRMAGAFVRADGRLTEARKKLQELQAGVTDAEVSERGAQQSGPNPAIAQAEKEFREASDAARRARLSLDSRIAQLLAASRKRRIKELGLDTGRFRIQTFPTGAIAPGEVSTPTLDTSLFDPDKALNQPISDPALEVALGEALAELSATLGIGESIKPTDFEFAEMQLQALYSPYFRNPQSTQRAQLLEGIRERQREWRRYIEQDGEIATQIATLTPKIEARLNELRTKRPPVPPFKDEEFRNLYAEYGKLIQKREQLFRENAGPAAQSEEDSGAAPDQLVDAVANLRSSALEDGILLRYREDSSDYEEYFRNADFRKARQERWQALREWIAEGESETPPAALAARFPDGRIGNSRTEAEQILWKLDCSPLLAKDAEDVSGIVLGRNFAGVIRTLVDRTNGLREIAANRNRAIVYALGIASLSILVAILISGFVVQKIKRIIRSAEDVGEGNLNIEFEHGGNDEFGNLTTALNSMVTGLRDREKIKGILGSMVDPVVVTEAMKDLQALKRGSEKRITAFFSDVAGFSTISEKLSSVELAMLLNEYLSAMTDILKQHEGVLDKYIGDAIVGIWNAPVEVDHHCLKAVKATLRMVDRMIELREQWTREQKYIPEARAMRFRVGLNTGLAKVGFMGTDALASYTMMGDTVNLAARLEAAGKDYGVELLATEAVFKEVQNEVHGRKLDLVRVKGKTEPVALYEFFSDSKNPPASFMKAAELYEKGFNEYLKRDWRSAVRHFEESVAARGRPDKSAELLIERCRLYEKEPPGKDWDGVFTREHK